MIPSPWLAFAAALAIGAAYLQGRLDGMDIAEADQLRQEQAIELASRRAERAAATAIASITVRNTTIRAAVEREIHEKPVYLSAGCRLPADGLRLVNAALADRSEPAGDRELPAADATR